MYNFHLVLVAILILAFPISSSEAAQNNVTFNATINATCTIVVDNNGTLVPDVTLQSLSSQNSGGVSGRATVTTTGGVTLSVDPSPIMTVPPGDNTTTNWTPTYSSTGSQTIAETSAGTLLTASGSNTVSINLSGVKSGTDRFKAGNYSGTVVVRCE